MRTKCEGFSGSLCSTFSIFLTMSIFSYIFLSLMCDIRVIFLCY